jgi:hypothetical protein
MNNGFCPSRNLEAKDFRIGILKSIPIRLALA